MKKYKVNVNGTEYEIELELIEDDGKMPVKKPELAKEKDEAPAASPEVKKEAAPAAKGEGKEITCPMPGNILSVNVSVGDKVKEGQVIMVLEAMKMENEIMATQAGTITSIAVSKGETVESGSLLYTIA